MDMIIQILVMALLVEAVWETTKITWQEGKFNKDRVGALVIGQLIAWAIGIDIFKVVQLEPKVPFIGIIFLGILISRGSNFIHDLTNKFMTLKTNTEVETFSSNNMDLVETLYIDKLKNAVIDEINAGSRTLPDKHLSEGGENDA